MDRTAPLRKLKGRALLRKAAVAVQRLEKEIAEGPLSEALPGLDRNAADVVLHQLAKDAAELAAHLAARADLGRILSGKAGECAASMAAWESGRLQSREALKALNDLRHTLSRESGQAPADWDLDEYDGMKLAASPLPEPAKGLCRVYLEDIRSPFNVGTIFRTAEAFGFEELLLSPDCADPRHPRALRSSMGAVDMLKWRRIDAAELQSLGEIVALELGGVDIAEFRFPEGGILALGSEELGLSSGILEAAGERRVSIPMSGRKASINVAVAFGIAAQAWRLSLRG